LVLFAFSVGAKELHFRSPYFRYWADLQ
jgi:hypothetical protein